MPKSFVKVTHHPAGGWMISRRRFDSLREQEHLTLDKDGYYWSHSALNPPVEFEDEEQCREIAAKIQAAEEER